MDGDRTVYESPIQDETTQHIERALNNVRPSDVGISPWRSSYFDMRKQRDEALATLQTALETLQQAIEFANMQCFKEERPDWADDAEKLVATGR